jgi:hypothetical protein
MRGLFAFLDYAAISPAIGAHQRFITVGGLAWASATLMKRILAETQLEHQFTQYDLFAKCASDAQTLEHTRSLLTHANGHLSNRVYRRKPEKVKLLH